MVWGMVAMGAASIIGGLLSSKGAEDAGKAQAAAMDRAIAQAARQYEQGRNDIMDTMVPALSDYGTSMSQLREEVANGTIDVMRTFKDTATDADAILTQTGVDVRRALMGSSASAAGIPREQFSARYDQAANLPEGQQRNAAMQTMEQSIGNQQSGTTGGGAYLDSFQSGERNAQGGIDQTQESGAFGGIGGGMTPTPGQPITDQMNTNYNRGREAGDILNTGAINMAQDPSGSYVPEGETGFFGADARLQEGQLQGMAQLVQGTQTARGDVVQGRDSALGSIDSATQGAMGRLDPYSQVGQQALQRESAMSGALGPEAQQNAINSYIESPGQKYLREQQEQSLLRNQGAIGGLGGGRVRSALQEQAMGIASTQQQQYMENLRSLAGRGQQADTTGAGILASSGAQRAQVQSGAGTQLASLAEALGVRGADLSRMTASERAKLASDTGIQIAQLEQMIGTAQAGNRQTLGAQLASTQAGGIADITGLGERAATNELGGQQNISQSLANISVGQGTTLASLEAAKGSALAASTLMQGQAQGQMANNLGLLAAYGLEKNS